MPRMTSEDQETFLAEPHVGVVATVRQDGRPYTVPVW
ncbi:MAG: pyridoxamine 5'-phosphate oxidase family protein, partial [Actinomycetia bacterium]|nr:pyridoxamine 5'-phosphate oxidase family protein [Actinomycetes bacterium]